MEERSSSYTEIMRKLAYVSDAEKMQLYNYLKSLLRLKGKLNGEGPVAQTPAKQNEDGVYVVYEVLIDFLRSKGVYEYRPGRLLITSLRSGVIGKGAERKCESLWRFVSKQTKNKLERRAILRLGFDCHMRTLEWMDSVSLPQMLRTADEVPASIDSEFPGYAASGMLAFVVRNSAKLKDVHDGK